MGPGLSSETTGAPETVPPTRESVLADLVRLQALSRELGELCSKALENRGDLPARSLSEKAEESVRLVERLTSYASGEESLEQYREATARLECLLQDVSSANDPGHLEAVQQRAVDAVNDWAAAVERVLEGVLDRARP